MLIIRLYRLFYGYLRVEISGENIQKFLKNCTENGISVWSVKKRGKTVRLNILKSDFINLFTNRKTGEIKAHILLKKGFPFFIARYKKRYGILIGCVLYIAVIYLLSTRVWYVGVNGNKKTDSYDIVKCCEEIGVYDGVKKKDIDTDLTKLLIMKKCPYLAWAAVNIEGSTVTVDVTEAADTDLSNENQNVISDLIATDDGIITKNLVTNGRILAQVGTVVTKGEKLVSGEMLLKNGNSYFVRSGGQVLAECAKEYTVKIPKNQTVSSFYGKRNYKIIYFFGRFIPLYFGNPKDTVNTANVFSVTNGTNSIPLKLYSVDAESYNKTDILLNKDKAGEIAESEVTKLLNNCKILSKSINFSENENDYVFNYSLMVEKNIALEEKMLNNTVN